MSNNVMIKLAEARVKLQESGMSKSGENKFAKYKYFELGDFLPKINQINKEVGILSVFGHSEDEYTLTVFDSQKDASLIRFSCPKAGANLKGNHDIQNLGAILTYARRYLYMLAYEIAENDMLDSGHNGDGIKTKNQKNIETEDHAISGLYCKKSTPKKETFEEKKARLIKEAQTK